MNIRGLLRLTNLAIAIGLFVLAATIIFSCMQDGRHMTNAGQLTTAIKKVVIIHSHMNAFQRTGDSRSAQQTRVAFDELGQALNAIAVTGNVARELKQRTIQKYKTAGKLFAQLADFRPASGSESGTDRRTIVDGLAVGNIALAASVLEMEELLTAQMREERHVALLAVATSFGVLVGIILVPMYILRQRVLVPIVRLEAVVKKMISGDLDAVMTTAGNDEISQLAFSFNTVRISLLSRISAAVNGSQALGASELRYRSLFNGMTESCALYDIIFDKTGRALDARFIAVNAAFEQRTGLTATGVAGRTLLELLPETKFLWIERLEIVARTGKRFHAEDVVDSAGRQFLVRIYPDGPGQVAVVHKDITKRKRIASELRQHRDALEILVAKRTRELSALYNNAPCGYHSVNAEGVFVRVNDTELSWLGYTREEMVGRMKAVDLLSPDSQEIFHERFPVLLAGGMLYGIDVEMVCKDGTILPVLLQTKAVFDANGQFLHSLSTIIDNTERLAANQALIRARELAEKADRAKSNFVANLSHEIRTPLHAILGYAYLLDKIGVPDEEHALIIKIEKAGRLLLGLLNDILDFSKIEADKFQIEAVPFHLGEVLSNIANVMSVCASDKSLDLTLTPPPAGFDYLRGDSMRLEQVMNNLVSNAVKFTPAGSVDVGVSVVSVSAQRVMLRFSVSDTGVGIHEDIQNELFKPFTQADPSTTRLYGGTGLGLAISRQLVELMGGEMGLISRPGKGSEFWFTAAFGRENTAMVVMQELADSVVLIANSNQVAREALRIVATNLGWEAEVVCDDRHALDQVCARAACGEGYDVIILDAEVPGMDVLETARMIRQSLQREHEPVILVVTGQARQEALLRIEGGCIDAVLSTPVTALSLHNVATRVLKKRRGGSLRSTLPRVKRLEGIHMLVVDDNDINRDVAVRIFGGEGALVASASNGREALDWLAAHSEEIDIVLMDIQMPVMDGYETVRQIRKITTLAQLPVVALTARFLAVEQEQARAAGMTDCIGKPFDIEMTIELMQRLLVQNGLTGGPPLPLQIYHNSSARDQGFPELAAGLARWRDATVYMQYLQKFASRYSDFSSVMQRADQQQAQLMAHDISGAAGTLGLNDVAAAAACVDRTLECGTSADAACKSLQDALDVAMYTIARYVEAGSIAALDSQQEPEPLSEVCRQILMAVSHLLNGIDDALVELDTRLPVAAQAALRSAIENFDFRGTSLSVRQISEKKYHSKESETKPD